VAAPIEWPIAECGDGKGQEWIALAPDERTSFVIHTLDSTGFAEPHRCAKTIRAFHPCGPTSRPIIS
jgi:hypothetical protein